MQLLTMAMQTEQEEDSNGNHVTDASTTTTSDNNSGPASTTSTSTPHDVILPRPSIDVHAPLETRKSPDYALEGTPTAVLQQYPSQSCRPSQLFPPVASYPAPCNDSFCNVASSAVDSDSSSSPDINSNTLTVSVGQADTPTCQEADVKQGHLTELGPQVAGSVTPQHVSSGAWVVRDMAEYAKLSSLDISGTQALAIRENLTQTRRDTAESETEHMTLIRQLEGVATVPKTLGTLQGGVQAGIGSRLDQRTIQDRPDLFPLQWASKAAILGESSLRHSVDMEVDDCDTIEQDLPSAAAKPRSPFVPQRLPRAGPAADDRPVAPNDGAVCESAPLDSHTARTVPVFVLAGPPGPSAHPDVSLGSFDPPLWTSLALACIKGNVHCEGCTDVELSRTAITSLGTAQDSRAAPSPPRSSATSDARKRASSLSPASTSRSSSGPVDLISSSEEPQLQGCTSTSSMPQSGHVRSSSSTSRDTGQMQASERDFAAENLIIGESWEHLEEDEERMEEEWEEEECASYARRLEPCIDDVGVWRGRSQLANPVARVLCEGDDMHFVPVREDPLPCPWLILHNMTSHVSRVPG